MTDELPENGEAGPTAPDLKAQRKKLRLGSRRLHGAEREPDFVELERVAAWCKEHDIETDEYGDGEALQAFEARVATLLGYPAGRFMPSGTMAQPIALRIWAERSGIDRFGMHPTCHLELHEQRGYSRLHGLDGVLVGEPHRPMTAADLATVPDTLAALIVELPTREIGGQLAEWSELIALVDAARQRGIATHLDGARLWEAAAGYDRGLSEICELFDTTYVSFYKGIDALPGSVLAGPADVIEEAAVWQRRQGGNLFTSMANWVSADMRLDTQLAKMANYRDRAKEIAAALGGVSGVRLNPPEPHVNMFHVFLQGEKKELLLARDRVAMEHDIWLFGGLATTDVPHTFTFEFTIGDAALNLDVAEIVTAFEALTA